MSQLTHKMGVHYREDRDPCHGAEALIPLPDDLETQMQTIFLPIAALLLQTGLKPCRMTPTLEMQH